LTVFYIYTGIEQVALWAERKKAPNFRVPQKWIRALLAIGILICLSKCFDPLGEDKRAYFDAARWIKANSQEEEWFYTHDHRIPFYAERNFFYYGHADGFLLEPYAAKYLVIPEKNNRTQDEIPERMRFEMSFSPEDGKGEGVVIYRYVP
jgi:hypothetical protein